MLVQSPSEALLNVQLYWNYPVSINATVLGDHWERTYGDVSFAAIEAKRKMPWYFIQHDDNGVFVLA